jgi:hypothetical protein
MMKYFIKDTRKIMNVNQYYASLEQFLASLSLGNYDRINSGGSNAHIQAFLCKGKRYVVKYLRMGAGLVDGHDYQTFATKIDQIQYIHEFCPDLRQNFVTITNFYKGDDGAAFVMPFYDGQSICDLMEEEMLEHPNSIVVNRMFDRLSPIVTRLIRYGYLAKRYPSLSGSTKYFYIDRVLRRLSLLREYLDPYLFDENAKLIINGVECRTATRLIEELCARTEWQLMLLPPVLHFPVHGDLNLDNLILMRKSEKFVVLDPRGTLNPWDAIYDFGKMLFTLTAFHETMKRGFVILQTSPGVYEVAFNGGQSKPFQQAADAFVYFLIEHLEFQMLVQDDPRWLERLLFAHAFHALADAACRISDSKIRYFKNASAWQAQLNLAVGFYLLGTFLLENVMSVADPKDAAIQLPIL